MEAFIALLKTLAELAKDPMVRIILVVAAATWLISMLVTNAVTAMERPTDSSTARYRYWFKFLNGIVGSWKRMEKDLHIPGVDTGAEDK
jgi:hypothetical protein